MRTIMCTDYVSLSEEADQESVAHLFAEFDLLAVPVVDASGRMQGIITIDDIVHVVTEEASKDLQKFVGSEALHSAYMDTGLWEMIKKRAGWLAVLFVGEMLTATAMAYEDHLARAVVLAVFVPLSSAAGGTLDLRPRLSSSAPWRWAKSDCGTGGAFSVVSFPSS